MSTIPEALPGPAPRPERGGRDSGSGGRRGLGRIANARIAVVMLIAAETMLFTGLIGAYLVLRFGTVVWPPAGQPRLPIPVTAANTLLLFLSAWTMSRATRALRAMDVSGALRALRVTAFLGAAFVAVQGSEWARLLAHGLTLGSSVYGATFYVLIGAHATHVLAALLWVLGVLFVLRKGPITARRRVGAEVCATYWYYVCFLWAILFPLVYLV